MTFLQGPLTPTNYDSLVSMATTEITNQLEASVMKASFNRVSCQIIFVSYIPHNLLCSNNLLKTSPSDYHPRISTAKGKWGNCLVLRRVKTVNLLLNIFFWCELGIIACPVHLLRRSLTHPKEWRWEGKEWWKFGEGSQDGENPYAVQRYRL